MNTEKTEELLESKEPDKKETKPHRSGKKQKILAAIIVCALLVAGVLIYLFAYRPAQVSKNLELAKRYLAEENYDEAILAYNKVIQIDAKNKDAYIGLGKTYMGQENYTKAEESLRNGLDNISDTNAKVDLYTDLIDVYETSNKDEDSIKELEDEAFDVTGDRQFGAQKELEISRYLENMADGMNSIIPAFDKVDAIDKNWVASRTIGIHQSEEEIQILKNAGQLEESFSAHGIIDQSIQANAKRTINPEIQLPKDFDYQLVEKPGWHRKYDKTTGIVYVRGGTVDESVFYDFYVTDLKKENDQYVIEGIYYKLTADSDRQSSFDVKTVNVSDSDTDKKVGTAKRSQSGSESLEGFYKMKENATTFKYNLTDKSSKIYRYVLTDNPDGSAEKGGGNYYDSFGPYYLLSRTETGQTLADINQAEEEKDTVDEEVVYAPIIEKYIEGISNKWDAGQFGDAGLNFEMGYRVNTVSNPTTLETAGFAYQDIDNNGVEELMIVTGDSQERFNAVGGMIWALYTIEDNELVLVQESQARSQYYLCENNVIANEGSGGAANSMWYYYDYKGGTTLEMIEGVEYNAYDYPDDPWLYKVTPDSKTPEHIMEYQAKELRDSYQHVDIEFTPFSEY